MIFLKNNKKDLTYIGIYAYICSAKKNLFVVLINFEIERCGGNK